MGHRLTTRVITTTAVERYLAALNAHDADAIAACVSEDFVNEHTSVGGVSRHGRAEYRAALDTFLADFQQLHYEAEGVLVDGARAAVPYRMNFVLDGRSLTVRGVFVFEIRDGLISHRTDYWDSGQLS